ncbi:hypothetical protein [Paenibacillus methanolicus]|uniref:Uncharacterized protein n=1 Tax=Paenibacillus methanolicus TaxID=582686 RepID=A0A5S5BK20_9BACL|nr:hypothetical protein [Paenibacillus methanolicus]TYP67391.1 hypothetical protein BCM02_1249 [Paenibacillus methanolicus]
MGRDFTSYLGHSLQENEIFEFMNVLNTGELKATNEFIQQFLPYNPEDKDLTWKVDTFRLGGTISLDGPCGLGFTFSEHVCMVRHYTRWLTFLLNDLEFDIRTPLRNMIRELAWCLGSRFAIYAPDSGARESGIMDFMWEDENEDIECMRNWLLQNCGPPAGSIQAIYKEFEDHIQTDGYYIDVFDDDIHSAIGEL